GPVSKTGRCTNGETSGRTPSSETTGSNLADMGRAVAHVRAECWRGRLQSRLVVTVLEAMRKACGVLIGEAAGEKLGTAPVHRCMVNVGTVPQSPSRWPTWLAMGRTAVVW